MLTLPEALVEVDDGADAVEEADLEAVGLDEAVEEGAEAPETNAAIAGPGNV